MAGENSWTTSGPDGANVWSIANNPYDSSMIFLGTSDGGFYKTTDNGKTWDFKGIDLLYSYRGGKFITSNIATTKNNILLLASGAILYKSIDIGDHWDILFGGLSGIITSIAIHPNNDNVIYFGFLGGGEGPMGNPGIYKTTDGGTYWYPVNDGLTNNDIIDLKISNQNPDVLFAATLEGIFKTTDGAVSNWQNISGNLPNVPLHAISLDPFDSNTLYIGTNTGIFKTIDIGISWQNVTGDNFKNRFINHHALITMRENNNILFAGTNEGLYKSSDGGLTWEDKNDNLCNKSVNYILPTKNDKIYLGTADGFYKSTDSGDTWNKNVQGLMAFNNTTITFNTIPDPTEVFVGTAGAGIYYSDNRGEFWYDMGIDTGFSYIMALASAPSNSQIMYSFYIGNTDSTLTKTELLKSEDGGHNWHSIGNNLKGKFVISIAVDPNDFNTVYAGVLNERLYKSTDGGYTWINKSNGIIAETIFSIAINPHNSNVIYIGTNPKKVGIQAGVYKSIDGGENWTYRSSGLPLEELIEFLDLCINPLNPETIYIALRRGGIYKSTTGGYSWHSLNYGIGTGDDKVINSIAIDPHDTNRVYAAGVKIYTSEDAGQTWQEMMESLPEYYGFINKIRLDPNDSYRIYAATDGYGVLTYYRKPTSVENDIDKKIPNYYVLYQNYPNPFNPSTNIRYQIPEAAKVTITIYNVKGNVVRTLVNENKPVGNYFAHWDGLDESGKKVASGVYIYRMIAGNFTDFKKLILTK